MNSSVTVTRSPAEFIRPCSQTPGGKLPLSILDRDPFVRIPVQSMLVFGGSPDLLKLGKSMREGLSKALVSYYPVAGKVSEEGGDLCVECTGEGVLFMEARASCSLRDVDYLQLPFQISPEELLPVQPLGDRVLIVQVTEFQCGGYAVCYIMSHIVFDATGIAQFLKAVGEMARGFPNPTIKPVWDRHLIPGPPPIQNIISLPSLVPLNLVQSVIDIPPETVNKLREQFVQATGRKCSVFEAVVAAVWQCRIRAIELDPTDEAYLGFPIDLRPLLDQRGYYGNCITRMSVKESSGKIANAPPAHAVGLIQEAMRMLPVEFWKRVKGEQKEELLEKFNSYATTIVTDIRRRGFYDIDFSSGSGSGGRGTPILFSNLDGSDRIAIGFVPTILITYPLGKSDGVRLTTICVKKEHLEAFRHQINSLGSLPTLNPRL